MMAACRAAATYAFSTLIGMPLPVSPEVSGADGVPVPATRPGTLLPACGSTST